MNAIGPVEPGEHTYGQEPAPPPAVRPRRPRTRRRRAAFALASALPLTAAGLALYATRPEPPAPPPPPYPAQVVSVTYDPGAPEPRPAGPHRFRFAVTFEIPDERVTGSPVTVERITQPSAALSVTARPAPPFTVTAGSPRTALVTMHIHDCGKVPRNAALPFLEVTLRNARAIETQSFILGPAYAKDLSQAINKACPPNTGVMSQIH